MTQSTETVSQRAREAAESHYPKHLWKDAARDDLAQAFARFERELSTSKDETIAKSLSDVIGEAKQNLRLTQGCLDCNAADERRWMETIAWLEGLA